MGDNELNKKVNLIERDLTDLRVAVNSNTNKIEMLYNMFNGIEKKLDNISKNTNSILKITYENREINSKIDELVDKIGEHEKRIIELEKKPGKVAVNAWAFIISIVVSGIIGAFINNILKG